jgi:hypothetical protein
MSYKMKNQENTIKKEFNNFEEAKDFVDTINAQDNIIYELDIKIQNFFLTNL